MTLKPEVNLTRRYYCSQDKLWGAIAEGLLFVYTGAIKETINLDFKTGGKIHIEWNEGGATTAMNGEFIEITPQSRIVFNWVTSAVAMSTVTLLITKHSDYCEMNLRHEFPAGTATKEYDWGWDDAMYDLKKHLYKN